jgi:MFS family permease
VVFRSIQALGAGGIMSLSFTMIADLYDLEARAKMQGLISSVWGLAALIGPALGAIMTKAFGWPSIFYLNVPVGIVSAILVRSAWEDRPTSSKGKVDFAGAAFLALASISVLLAFNLGKEKGWDSPIAMGGFGAAIFFIVFLVVVERRRSDPFIAYDLYKSRLFTTGAATGVCAMLCLFGAIMYIPLLVTGVLGKSLQMGGNMLTCMMFPWMVCSALTKPLLKKFSYRILAIAGMILAGGAYFLLVGLDASAPLASVIAAMVVLGTGLGLTVAPLLIAAQNAVTKDRLGAATSLTQFTRSMGAAVGLTVMGTLFASAFGGKEPEGIIRFRAQLDPQVRGVMISQLVVGLHHVFRSGIFVAALGVLLAIAIPAGKAMELKLPQPAEG